MTEPAAALRLAQIRRWLVISGADAFPCGRCQRAGVFGVHQLAEDIGAVLAALARAEQEREDLRTTVRELLNAAGYEWASDAIAGLKAEAILRRHRAEQTADDEMAVIQHCAAHWFTQGGESQFGPFTRTVHNADELISEILSVVRAASAEQTIREPRSRCSHCDMKYPQHAGNCVWAMVYFGLLDKLEHESRSPDGDGLPIVKGLGDERAHLSARGEEPHQQLTPQQAGVHARRVADRNDESLLKPAAGSEPADSHQPTSAPSRPATGARDHVSVTVSRNGESVVTIETNCMSGRDITQADEEAIRWSATNLLGFIGARVDVRA